MKNYIFIAKTYAGKFANSKVVKIKRIFFKSENIESAKKVVSIYKEEFSDKNIISYYGPKTHGERQLIWFA